MNREKPREERFLHGESVVSRAGCVAVHGRSDFHAGSVAGKEFLVVGNTVGTGQIRVRGG